MLVHVSSCFRNEGGHAALAMMQKLSERLQVKRLASIDPRCCIRIRVGRLIW